MTRAGSEGRQGVQIQKIQLPLPPLHDAWQLPELAVLQVQAPLVYHYLEPGHGPHPQLLSHPLIKETLSEEIRVPFLVVVMSSVLIKGQSHEM
jgi:hypothetical protein